MKILAIPLVTLLAGTTFGYLLNSWNQPSPETRAYKEAVATSDWMLNRLLNGNARCDNDLWRDLVETFLHQQRYLSISEEVSDDSVASLAGERFESWKDRLYFLAINELRKKESSTCVEFIQQIGLYSSLELKRFKGGT